MVAYPEFIDIRPYTSEPKEEPITYGLHAVLVHAGTTCCYVKAPNGKWYNMNDQSVMLVDKATVLRQQVYLLFYTRFNNDEKRREPASSTQATLISQKPIITKPAIFGIDTMIKEIMKKTDVKREEIMEQNKKEESKGKGLKRPFSEITTSTTPSTFPTASSSAQKPINSQPESKKRFKLDRSCLFKVSLSV
ncbi:ubiquitin carboxyl-terminal hydrolase 36-like isoform X2 [Xenopus laevis]|uniref:Ubiquitin carboxyl-terminal hydrolase 36-like isoform X2 n=1 Tax=Xenopus laevis TaxID=8355 RepID=A0A8J1M2V1_XENLA|nr:ubiquitin carboxyl-terminal hydrolase 36-like isoform X2 [Xenopus laevis]